MLILFPNVCGLPETSFQASLPIATGTGFACCHCILRSIIAVSVGAKLTVAYSQVDLLTSAFGQIGPIQNVRMIKDKGGVCSAPCLPQCRADTKVHRRVI